MLRLGSYRIPQFQLIRSLDSSSSSSISSSDNNNGGLYCCSTSSSNCILLLQYLSSRLLNLRRLGVASRVKSFPSPTIHL